MKKKFEEDFPKDEEEEYFEPPIETTIYENTVELSNKGFSQEMVQEMNQNQLKISKLKLKNLIKEKKQIKQYQKENLLNKGIKGLIEIVEAKPKEAVLD